MPDEDGFLEAIKANPEDDLPRLVYADWLDERDDVRGDFVRLHLALKATAPDHIDRVSGEEELSLLRKGCDAAWLAVVEPEHFYLVQDPSEGPWCECYEGENGQLKQSIPSFHSDTQDTDCDAWKSLLDLIEKTATDGCEELALADTTGDFSQIRTLPPTIAKLKEVKTLNLYGSYLVRIPPEIGEMTSLETFLPYTSYRLHWFPYELTRCRKLRDSAVSVRALYGNYKYRSPYPMLDRGVGTVPGRVEPVRLPLKRRPANLTRSCSVCSRQFEDLRLHRVWVSWQVLNDVLPLLVNACSEECVSRLPIAPDGYLPMPHKGGEGVQQPPPRW
jgi:uncharacterized protein (TIGR02996 family)